MPRHVRNWWIELCVDGRKTCIAAGPVSATGGFTLRLKQREAGGIIHVGKLTGVSDGNVLTLEAHLSGGPDVMLLKTLR